jgi:pimeloyl-ACP methyl ester carboxylesterase
LEGPAGRKYGAVFRGGTTFLGGAPIVLSFESDPNYRPVAQLRSCMPGWHSRHGWQRPAATSHGAVRHQMSCRLLTNHGHTALGSSTLLLLPGLSCTAQLWQQQLAALRSAPTTATAHQPAAGGAATHALLVGNAHFSECLGVTAAALLEQLPAGGFSVVGHSLGGYLALELARCAPPGRLERMALVSTQARADSPPIQARRMALMDAVARDGPTASISPPELLLGRAARRGGQWGSSGSRSAGQLWELVEAMAMETTATGFARGCTAAMRRPDSRPTLRQLPPGLPLTFVVGDEDAITPVAATREMARLAVPSAELHVIADCGHLAPLEQPRQVTAAITRLLAAPVRPSEGER